MVAISDGRVVDNCERFNSGQNQDLHCLRTNITGIDATNFSYFEAFLSVVTSQS